MRIARNKLSALLAALTVLAAPAVARADGGCADGKAVTRQPAEYCAVYKKSAPLQSDPHVKQVEQLCEKFFTEVVTSMNIFCAYAQEAKQVQASGAAVAASTQGQGSRRGSFRNAGIMTGQAREVYDKYLVQVSQEFDRLNSVDSAYRKAVKQLSVEGKDHLTSEVHCAKNGAQGFAEGAMVIGAAEYGLEYNLEVSSFMKRLLRIFNMAMHEGQLNADQMSKELAARDNHIGSAPNPNGGAMVDKGLPETPSYGPSDVASAIGQDRAVDIVDRAAKHLVGVENEVELGEEAERALLGHAGETLKKIIADESFGILLGAVLQAATAEKIDGLTLANIGVGVIAGAVGLATVPTIGLGIAVDIMETEIRKMLALKETRDILAPYFVYLKQHPEMDSAQASQGYKDSGMPRLHCEACCFGDSCQNASPPYTTYTDAISINYGITRKRPPADYVKQPFTVGQMSFCRWVPRAAK